MNPVYDNKICIYMDSKSQNEAFARIAVSAFAAPLDPTVSEITDLKTAVSEAVTNAIIHGYEDREGKIRMDCKAENNEIIIEISDEGRGIDDITQAMTPLYTTKPELERSGMGFTVMETFMDDVTVISEKGKGTKIIMRKKISRQ